MKNNSYQRKLRHLRSLSKEINRLLVSDNRLTFNVQNLIARLKRLVFEMRAVLSSVYLKKILGPAFLLLGIAFTNDTRAQSFLPPVQNPFGVVATNGYAMPAFADLDNDGDLDLLVGEYYGALQYFKNTGTAAVPSFSAPVMNPFGLVSGYYIAIPTFADLDGDGDKDLLIGEYYGNLQYYQNTGTPTAPNFAAPVANPFGLSSVSYIGFPSFVDIDGDGDMDLLVGEYGGVTQFFQNTGTPTSPSFAAPVTNAFGITPLYGLFSPTFADLDGDGDKDLIAGDGNADFNYFKNNGTASLPAFLTPSLNPFGLSAANSIVIPALVDLDNDGDHDLFVGEYLGGMKYYKNSPAAPVMDELKPSTDPTRSFATQTGNNITCHTVARQLNLTLATAPFKVGFYLSLDTNITASDFLVGTFTVNCMDPSIPACTATMVVGQPEVAAFVNNINLSVLSAPNGTYYVGTFIDSQSVIAEGDETNNDWAFRNAAGVHTQIVKPGSTVGLIQYDPRNNIEKYYTGNGDIQLNSLDGETLLVELFAMDGRLVFSKSGNSVLVPKQNQNLYVLSVKGSESYLMEKIIFPE